MSWEWSHTPEAYENAELNLAALPIETLIVIAAEWRAAKQDASYNWELNEKKYDRELQRLTDKVKNGSLSAELLAAEIWPKAESYATCDNGGFNASMCPFDCSPHMVSFDRFTPDAENCRFDRFDICLAWYVFACESYRTYEQQCDILKRLERMRFKPGLTDSSTKMLANWEEHENALNILARLERNK